MASKIKLDIVTPEKVLFSDEIEILIARAIDGDIGILPGHTPLVTGLKTGVLKIRRDGEEALIAISDGFMEVQPEQINLVVRTAELPEEIDVERAQSAMERAQKRLDDKKDEKINVARAEGALERAIARIKVSGRNIE